MLRLELWLFKQYMAGVWLHQQLGLDFECLYRWGDAWMKSTERRYASDPA